jgi:hypothetical protein
MTIAGIPHFVYASQSTITDPGPMAYLFDGLPTDVSSLRRIASGLVVHYRAEDLKAIGIPDERVAEINTRYVEQMLRRIIELDDRPLTEERPKEKRLVGCCRDFTVLFLSMLRHRGVPARGRVGFASYFAPGWNVDHEVAEVWDDAGHRWRLIDAELADTHVDPTDDATLDAMDLPRDRFLVGGTAWHACRSGQADPEKFLVDPGLAVPETRGWLQLRHNLVQDLAALNKREMLLWDDWGLLENGGSSDAELALLDRTADMTRQDDPSLSDMQSLYAEESGLRVPQVVTSFNLISGTPERVAVSV